MMTALLTILAPILDKVLGAVLPDPQAKAKAIGQILEHLSQADLTQMEVNKTEAAHDSIFVAGWRPFIGWCCGAALAYSYLVVPLTMYVSAIFGLSIPKPPVLDGNMWELMFGMLGMGAIRSFEKVKGIAGK